MIWDRVSVPRSAARLVARCEGLRLAPYRDAVGVWTIGLGDTRDFAGNAITASTPPLTEAQADALCARALGGAADSLARLVAVPLDTNQAAALIDWIYNEGGGWHVAESSLVRDLCAGDVAAVPGHLREWVYAGGRPLLGLLRRRWAEAAVWQGWDADAACDRAWSEISALGQWPKFAL